MRALSPSNDAVIVSMLDQLVAHNRPDHLHRFGDYLILKFVDIFEKPREPQWPDQMTEEEHRAVFRRNQVRAPQLCDARSITAFVGKHHRSAQ